MPSGLLGAVGSIAGGLLSASSSKSAARTQAASADAASQAQLDMYNQSRSDQLPFLSTGTGGNRQLGYLLGISPADIEKEQGNTTDPMADPYASVNKSIGAYGSLAKPFGAADFQADPGYQFRMDEGMKALQRSAAAKGSLLSGAALKGITRFAQGTASDEYQNAYNRYNTNQTNLYNRLAGISGTGQTSANTLASTGQNTANQVSEIGLQKGNALAAGQVGAANAWSTGLSNIGGNLGSGIFNNSGQSGLPWQSFGSVNPAGGFYF